MDIYIYRYGFIWFNMDNNEIIMGHIILVGGAMCPS